MQRFTGLLVIMLIAIVAGVTGAQENSGSELIVLDDVVVICPGDEVQPTVRAAAQLVVQFTAADSNLVIPFARFVDTADGRAIEIGRIELTCTSNDAEILQVNRSPAVAINQTAPQPSNPAEIALAAENYLIVVTGPANLRSCDEPTCSQVGIVRGGEELVPIGRNADRSWWYVQAGDIRGWIWSDLIAVRGDVTDIPIVQTAGEPTAPRVYIGFTGNPLYDVLSTDGQIICRVQGGNEYPLLGRNADTSWVYIEANCTDGTVVQGWINANQVAIRNTGQVAVPVVNAEGNQD